MHCFTAGLGLLLLSSAMAQTVQADEQEGPAPLIALFGKEPLPPGLLLAQCSAIADLDGDGHSDLLVQSSLSSSAELGGLLYFRGRGDGTFDDVTAWRYRGSAWGIGTFVLADVDGDGDLDVCGAGSILRNVGGTLVEQALPTSSMNWKCVAAGDLDGDGDIDLFVGIHASGGPEPDRVLLNNGSGSFSLSTSSGLPADADTAQAAALADVDGDGDLDLVLGIERQAASGGGARLHLNDGHGTFTDASTRIAMPLDNVTSVLVRDFDRDGDQDILLATTADLYGVEQPDRLFRNLGNGQFALDGTALPPVLASTRQIVAVDLDFDGDLDLALSIRPTTSGPTLRAYANNGSGLFAAASTLMPAIWANSIDRFDANGDGRPDLLVGYGPITFLLQQGAGMVVSQPLGLLTAQADKASLFDFDGDGDLDICVRRNSSWRLWRNDGGFSFVEAPDDVAPASQFDGVFGKDLDGDGDAELIAIPLYNDVMLLSGRRVQLHAPAIARLGMPYELRLRTAPWAVGQLRLGMFLLNLAPLDPPLSIPGFGVLRVDPTGAIIALGAVPSGGDPTLAPGLRLRLPLPNLPALVGTTLYSQALAWTTGAMSLTNRVSDAIH